MHTVLREAAQTDGQTDRQTDKMTQNRPDRKMSALAEVKNDFQKKLVVEQG